MFQTLNLNHNLIVYSYNNYMKKCIFNIYFYLHVFLIDFLKKSNLICYNTKKNRHQTIINV